MFARVRALAVQANPSLNGGFESLPDVVESAYRALVAGFIAGEQRCLEQTELIGSASADSGRRQA